MEKVGGQAIIEGVLMQSPKRTVMAARNPDGKIVFKTLKRKSLTKGKPYSFPIIRGVISMGEMLSVGMKALNWSSSMAIGRKEEKITKTQFAFSVVLATVMALALFKLLPLGVAQLFSRISALSGRFAFNIIEGMVKLSVLIGYVWAIGFMPDIRRLFQYHGAEHKAVNCYESGKSLTPRNAAKFSTAHRRCGTSFLLLVVLTSVLVYIFLPMQSSFLAKYALRIALLPVIAGIAYEILKLSSKYEGNMLLRAVSWPGMQIQGLTTRQPSIKQMEVAVQALKKAVK